MGKTVETKIEYKKSFKNSKRDAEVKKENPFGSAVMDDQQKEKLIKEKLANLSIPEKNNETPIIKIMKNESKDIESNNNRKSPNTQSDYQWKVKDNQSEYNQQSHNKYNNSGMTYNKYD